VKASPLGSATSPPWRIASATTPITAEMLI
jgi:hypothetical protein